MRRSADRILTTHVGSLPRPDALIEVMIAQDKGETVDEAAFETKLKNAVGDVVKKQVELGVDVVDDVREEILVAATKVFSEKGFHATTIDDIATQAEVSKGSIYIHFDSKEAMIDGLSEQWQTTDDEVFDTAEKMPRAIDGLAHVTKATIRRAHRTDFRESSRMGLFVWAEMLINPAVTSSQRKLGDVWKVRMDNLARRAKEAGDIGPDHTINSVVSFLGSLSGGVFLARAAWGAEPDADGLERLVDTFIASIG